jgi:hypothetical protein
MKPLLALAAGALLTFGATACGGGASTNTNTNTNTSASAPATSATATTSSPPVTTTSTGTTPPPASGAGGSASSSGEGATSTSQAKRYPHGDNSIQTYGRSAGEAEKQAVTAAVKHYYAAVAAGDGASACTLLSSGLSKSIVQTFGRSPTLRGKGCAGLLSLLFKRRPGHASASLAAIEVTGVRVKGDHGFALLRSKTMPSGEISVEREAGGWKIGAQIRRLSGTIPSAGR